MSIADLLSCAAAAGMKAQTIYALQVAKIGPTTKSQTAQFV
jgi:hypothetical protein